MAEEKMFKLEVELTEGEAIALSASMGLSADAMMFAMQATMNNSLKGEVGRKLKDSLNPETVMGLLGAMEKISDFLHNNNLCKGKDCVHKGKTTPLERKQVEQFFKSLKERDEKNSSSEPDVRESIDDLSDEALGQLKTYGRSDK